ncbi:hypothetical protein Taro_019990 [Colocasia esculenta]|uniref:Uncharacterized protein n=1 Tax=Colocasia esculenta TaxID=4460 RepID=A0A843V0R9_COLES|nr:hypothetical protein [Colocasia esculenta]
MAAEPAGLARFGGEPSRSYRDGPANRDPSEVATGRAVATSESDNREGRQRARKYGLEPEGGKWALPQRGLVGQEKASQQDCGGGSSRRGSVQAKEQCCRGFLEVSASRGSCGAGSTRGRRSERGCADDEEVLAFFGLLQPVPQAKSPSPAGRWKEEEGPTAHTSRYFLRAQKVGYPRFLGEPGMCVVLGACPNTVYL